MGGLAEKKGRENLSIKVDQWKAGWMILRSLLWFHEDLGRRRM